MAVIDSEFFEQIFRAQFRQLCNIAYNITRNQAVAEDIVQEVFLKMWQKKEELNIHSNYVGYLYRSTTNACIDYLKNNRNVIPLSQAGFLKSATESGEGLMIQKELNNSIDRAMRALPPKCRAIFILSRNEGMKYKEIAGHLKLSVKTVENQMGIALAILRDELKPFLTREFLNNKKENL